jgi:hypothetical protein
MPGMKIGYDPAKDAANIRDRGLSLAFGATVLAHRIGEVEDTRKAYGETRIKAFGEVEGRLFCCVYTMRGDVHHIITVHRVRPREARKWLASR